MGTKGKAGGEFVLEEGPAPRPVDLEASHVGVVAGRVDVECWHLLASALSCDKRRKKKKTREERREKATRRTLMVMGTTKSKPVITMSSCRVMVVGVEAMKVREPSNCANMALDNKALQ